MAKTGDKKQRKYYSVRVGKKDDSISLDALKELFAATFSDFDRKGYFSEHFGFYCTDSGSDRINGIVPNIENYILRKIRKTGLWPVDKDSVIWYSEEDLFDMIEFLFDHVSKPLEDGATWHSHNGCGWHYVNFDKEAGQVEYASEINALLADYGPGYRLESTGEIFLSEKSEIALIPLLEAKMTNHDPHNIESKIEAAVSKFKRYKSTIEDRKDAVRSLADCLEFIRPQLGKVLSSKDESDLFQIANNFGIRHHNSKQRTNYDQGIWLSWMFYYYLATLHAVLRLLERDKVSIKK